jgi:hypothetical protein
MRPREGETVSALAPVVESGEENGENGNFEESSELASE